MVRRRQTRIAWLLSREYLVWRGRLDVVDDEGLHGAVGGGDLEARLLLDRGEERWAGGAGGAVAGGHRIGRPLQGEVVFSGEAGLVDDGALEFLLQIVDQRVDGDSLAEEPAPAEGHHRVADGCGIAIGPC